MHLSRSKMTFGVLYYIPSVHGNVGFLSPEFQKIYYIGEIVSGLSWNDKINNDFRSLMRILGL